jgi:CspA family cold shock protein
VVELKTGQRVEFGVVDSRKGAQAMGVKLIDAPPSLAELRRRPAEELHSMVEDMIKVLESQVQPGLSRGRYPDKRVAQKIAQLVHAVAKEFEV